MFSMIRYHFVLNLRERTMVFWTLAFPILLGIFFYVGIGGVDEASKFDVIPVAVVGMDEPEESTNSTVGNTVTEVFREFLSGIDGELVRPFWNMSEKEAKQALEDKEVSGIFRAEEGEITLTVGGEGLDESILSALLTGFEQKTAILEEAQEKMQEQIQKAMESQDMEAANEAKENYQELVESVQRESTEYVKEVSLGGRDVSSVTSYYFALLAMACLYMCFLGETAAKRTQANISSIGKRICVSPAHRLKVVLANGISAYLVALINIAIIMVFLIKIVHGIDISMHPGYAVLTTMMGCLIGVTFGIMIESIGKWSQNIKSAILIGSSIFCAFLAGLMIGSMKDIIEKHVPVINRINPAAMISDSFYCICVYDDMGRLQTNLISMGVMSILFLIVAWILTRRVRYDSL